MQVNCMQRVTYKHKWQCYLLLLLTAFSLTTVAHAADITFEVSQTEQPQTIFIYITGEIIPRDAKRVAEIISTHKYQDIDWKQVFLDSRGGNLITAMQIGYLLRHNEYRAGVRPGALCISSCVYILAGAVEKSVSVGARVGIHRPYPTTIGAQSLESAQQEYDLIVRASREYFQDMNVSEDLLNTMVRTRSDEVRFLSHTELQEFGLVGTDPAYQFSLDSRAAAKFGVPRSVLLERRAMRERSCDSDMQGLTREAIMAELKRNGDCQMAIMWGLSIGEYTRRRAIVRSQCVEDKAVKKEDVKPCAYEILRNGSVLESENNRLRNLPLK